MRIAQIAHGWQPIPAPGWGAVEALVWQRTVRLRELGHTVDIYNSPRIDDVIEDIDQGSYDFVHCHNERFAVACTARLRRPWALTSHFGTLYQKAGTGGHGAFQDLFDDTLDVPANIVLSDRIKRVYERSAYYGFLRVLPNTVETARFRCARRGRRDAVCVGKVLPLKRQAWLARTLRGRVRIDFVGPWDRDREPDFQENETARYLGSWTREQLYGNLTRYRCLVLLSESEAAPMVVPEALAAGVSVVTNETGAANLTDEEFITVLPDAETRPEVVAEAVQHAIDRNRSLRPAIRRYACERFDESAGIRDYLDIIEEFRAFYGG